LNDKLKHYGVPGMRWGRRKSSVFKLRAKDVPKKKVSLGKRLITKLLIRETELLIVSPTIDKIKKYI